MRKIACATGEVVTTYTAYLRTKHWKNIKAKYKETHDYKCTRCPNNKIGLHLHHLSYKNIGNENMDDLMYLCEKCHMKEHEGKHKKKQKVKQNDNNKMSKQRQAMQSFIGQHIRKQMKYLPDNVIEEIYNHLKTVVDKNKIK